jgi:hypothetical protein
MIQKINCEYCVHCELCITSLLFTIQCARWSLFASPRCFGYLDVTATVIRYPIVSIQWPKIIACQSVWTRPLLQVLSTGPRLPMAGGTSWSKGFANNCLRPSTVWCTTGRYTIWTRLKVFNDGARPRVFSRAWFCGGRGSAVRQYFDGVNKSLDIF